MRTPITDPTHVKNKIIIMTYIFRSLPYLYIELTATSTKERQELQKIVINLKKTNYIAQKRAKHSLAFLHLTKKGYEFVTKSLMKRQTEKGEKSPFYAYRSLRSLRGAVTEHQYMNFAFIWDWITKNPEKLQGDIEVYEDSNINQCKLTFTHGGKTIVLSPDVLILYPDEKSENSLCKRVVIVENDTGGETYKMVFRKFVEYAMLITQLNVNKISGGELLFVFPSQNRAEQMLFGEEGMTQFVENYNNTPKVKDVHNYDILSAYIQSELEVKYAWFNEKDIQHPYQFIPYNFGEQLLQRYPKWKTYLQLETTNYRLGEGEQP
jgi:hypothetical protein